MMTSVESPKLVTVADWLEEKFKVWSSDKPRRDRTLKAFARYIGIPYDTFFYYIGKGGKPEGRNLELIALHVGIEIYDLVGLSRPDLRLIEIAHLWGRLPDDIKDAIYTRVIEYGAERNGEREQKASV